MERIFLGQLIRQQTNREMLVNFLPDLSHWPNKSSNSHLDESPLIHKLPDRLQVGSAPGDVGLWAGKEVKTNSPNKVPCK